MKILSIPLLAHDSSICILEDGVISSYRMEERFSAKKHDKAINFILCDLEKINFDKIIIAKHFLEQYTYPLEKLEEKISNFSYQKLIFEEEKHHLYHAYSGFYK